MAPLRDPSPAERRMRLAGGLAGLASCTAGHGPGAPGATRAPAPSESPSAIRRGAANPPTAASESPELCGGSWVAGAVSGPGQAESDRKSESLHPLACHATSMACQCAALWAPWRPVRAEVIHQHVEELTVGTLAACDRVRVLAWGHRLGLSL